MVEEEAVVVEEAVAGWPAHGPVPAPAENASVPVVALVHHTRWDHPAIT